jgi:apolipoprotein N-acyltransferase
VLNWLGVERLAHGRFDFSAGAGPRTVQVPGAPRFSPLICYEAIFPHEAVDGAVGAMRPRWLLNLTNDAWFGTTSGPYQHLAAARLRSIEQGLPLVRTADRPPLYSWLGDWILLLLCLIVALLALWVAPRRTSA